MNNNEQDFYCEAVLVGKVEITTIMETEHTLAYYHTNPYYEKHAVVIPKKHIRSFSEMEGIHNEEFVDLLQVLQQVSRIFHELYGACTITTNNGDYQSNKHMHWHVHYGKRLRLEDGTYIEQVTEK